MKITVEIHRDEQGRPSILDVKRGRKKLRAEVMATDSMGYMSKVLLTGSREALPDFGDVLSRFFDGHIARIGTIDELTLLKFLEEISLIKKVETVGDVSYRFTVYGSEGTAIRQVAGAGAAWVSPTGYSDPDGNWSDEAKAYDDNDATYAENVMDYGTGWYGFLVLTLAAPTTCNKLRFKATLIDGGVPRIGRKVDVDVYKNGSWVNVDEIEDFDTTDWVEVGFTEGSIENVRLRFYSPHELGGYARLYEVDVYQVATSGGEPIIHAEQSDATKFKATVTQAIQPLATTPAVINKTLTVKDTEYSQALSANLKKVLVMCRDGTPFRLNWETGVGTTYFTVKEDGVYYEDNINVVSPTLYLWCSEAGKVIEILEWT